MAWTRRGATTACAAARALTLLVFASSAGAKSWCDAAPAPEFAGLEKAVIEHDWFEVYATAEGVFAISEPRQYEGVTSFLIIGSKRAVLFDSGLGVARIGEVVGRLTALPVTVLNSHTHFDHVGGNREFRDVRNLDEPYSLANSRGDVSEALADYASRALDEDHVCGALPAGVTSRKYEFPKWHVTAHIRDGERVDLGGRELEVLRTPGHTPDSICLLDRANGLLFTGDTYYSGEIYLWAPETSITEYTASIARLAALAPVLRKIFPAHGAPVAEPGRLPELQAALADISAGRVAAEPAAGNRRLFRFGHFTILMRQAL